MPLLQPCTSLSVILFIVSCVSAFVVPNKQRQVFGSRGGNDDDSLELVQIPARGQVSTHAIYGNLMHATGIQAYNVYRCLAVKPQIRHLQQEWLKQQQQQQVADSAPLSIEPRVVQATVKLGHALDGHRGTTHGGILALLLDDFLGHAYEAMGVPLAVTANLNIDFKAPVPTAARIQLRAHLTQWQGRKLYWQAQVVGEGDGSLAYCNATSLYIIPRPAYEKLLLTGFDNE